MKPRERIKLLPQLGFDTYYILKKVKGERKLKINTGFKRRIQLLF